MTGTRRTLGTSGGQVVVDLSISLDGFVAGPDDRPERALGEGGERLHAWIFGGDVPNDSQPFFEPVKGSRRIVDEWLGTVGALLTGRRTFDLVDGWGGSHPLGVPIVVLTHRPPPAGQEHEGTTFVSDGIETAVARAKAAADGRNVWIHGASVAQQCLRAGLLDALQLHVVPVLLGGGVRLFAEDGFGPVDLRHVRTVDSDGVTHLRYEVCDPQPRDGRAGSVAATEGAGARGDSRADGSSQTDL